MPVSLTLCVDRFEGKDHSLAVLLSDDGATVNMPRSLLPPDLKPGDVVTFAIEHDPAATRRVADGTGRVQRELSQGDPGGDIRL